MSAEFETVDALVLREVRYKEADKILTLYTPTKGKISVRAIAAYSKSKRLAAATQQLTYSEMTLYKGKSGTEVREAIIKEPFDGLRKDFSNYSLGCYFSECIEALADEADARIMQLALNCLYALSNILYSPELIKATFEMRLMCLLGYAPDLEACVVCGRKEPVEPVLGIQTGHVCCRACRNANVGNTDYLDAASFGAMKHIVYSPAKQIIPHELEKESLEKLSRACEDFMMIHSERSFSTLDYWKKVK